MCVASQGQRAGQKTQEPGTAIVSEMDQENFSYREIEDLSEATEDNIPGEGKRGDELDDYERLVAGTQK